MFCAFVWFEFDSNKNFQVLKVESASNIIIDLNKNGVADANELVTIDDCFVFSTKPSHLQNKIAKNLAVQEEDALGIGFLAQNFSKQILENQKVKLINSDIFIANKSYKKMLLEKGFAIEEGKAPNENFKKNIIKSRLLNLRIFNNKSHKYHKLNCKYGLLAHNSQILPAGQIPKDAKPCQFCFSSKKHPHKKRLKQHYINSQEFIPNIKSPETAFKNGAFEVYLTDLTKVLKPANTCSTKACQTLLREINQAQNSIDFAIYGYTKVPALQNALQNAQKRGVRIRFVYDLNSKKENIYPDTNYLASIFSLNRADCDPAIMHDKFFIFDNQKVFTGSANISNTDMSGYNSNVMILIDSKDFASIYSQEFEQMYSGSFHKLKSKILNKTFMIDNSQTEIFFSPKDKSLASIIKLVDGAEKYISMPVFLITHKQLTESLVRASKRGVRVKVILDATNAHTSYSKHKWLRQNGIQVKTENFAGKMHSKSIIIDDKYVIIGSMNFSKSGEAFNDENLIILKNEQIAIFYQKFFLYLWQKIPNIWLSKNARAESFDSIGSCHDGIDNDFDGKIDKMDDSCNINKAKIKN